MGMKEFLMKKMLASKMKGVPQADQDKVFSMLEKNPKLFETIALEVQEEMKKGINQMQATMNVVKRHETELRNLQG